VFLRFLTNPVVYYLLYCCRNSVRLSVRPSVRVCVRLTHACIVTKLNDGLRTFWHHTKRQSP